MSIRECKFTIIGKRESCSLSSTIVMVSQNSCIPANLESEAVESLLPSHQPELNDRLTCEPWLSKNKVAHSKEDEARAISTGTLPCRNFRDLLANQLTHTLRQRTCSFTAHSTVPASCPIIFCFQLLKPSIHQLSSQKKFSHICQGQKVWQRSPTKLLENFSTINIIYRPLSD